LHIAQQKAAAVQNIAAKKTILAADTIQVLGKEIIGKPADREDAISILMKLSGRQHRVITAVVLQSAQKTIAFTDSTDVEFHTLTKQEIGFYIDKYKPYDKAGAYAIQEWIGVVGIKKITGDFYNVMGLPVSRVVQALKTLQDQI
ncbi:MAG: septum formation protein Maf, partial [Sphingobacteriales bacterium]